MRPLYEINADLEALLTNVNEETGELLIDPEALDALLLEKQEKLEGVALYCKNISAEAAAIKGEIEVLRKRLDRLEKDKDGLTQYLQRALGGEKFETAKVVISYRKSEQTEITDEDQFWTWALQHGEYIRQKPPEADKAKIKAAIKAGETIPGAEVVQKVTMSIR